MADDAGDDSKAGWFKFGAPTAIAVATIVAGLIQFGTTSAFSIRQPFLEMQTKLCSSAAEHVARLASTRDPVTWQKSREEFWMLYWGPLAIVEDVESQSQTRVETAMVAYGDKLSKIDTNAPTLPISSLEEPALEVSHACRDLLGAKWNSGILTFFRQQ